MTEVFNYVCDTKMGVQMRSLTDKGEFDFVVSVQCGVMVHGHSRQRGRRRDGVGMRLPLLCLSMRLRFV